MIDWIGPINAHHSVDKLTGFCLVSISFVIPNNTICYYTLFTVDLFYMNIRDKMIFQLINKFVPLLFAGRDQIQGSLKLEALKTHTLGGNMDKKIFLIPNSQGPYSIYVYFAICYSDFTYTIHIYMTYIVFIFLNRDPKSKRMLFCGG